MFVAEISLHRRSTASYSSGQPPRAIIRKHYLDLKTTEQADEFFGIMPKRAVGAATGSVAFPALRLAI